ncbi:MAG: hypothetical protein ACR2L2_11905, partial [Acidobacteriota bacterium]
TFSIRQSIHPPGREAPRWKSRDRKVAARQNEGVIDNRREMRSGRVARPSLALASFFSLITQVDRGVTWSCRTITLLTSLGARRRTPGR